MELPPSYEEATKQDDAFTRIVRVGSQFCRQVFELKVFQLTNQVYRYCTPQSKMRSEKVEILVFLPTKKVKYDLRLVAVPLSLSATWSGKPPSI